MLPTGDRGLRDVGQNYIRPSAAMARIQTTTALAPASAEPQRPVTEISGATGAEAALSP